MEDYAAKIGLSSHITKPSISGVVVDAFGLPNSEFTNEDCEILFTYKVPKLTPDGTCSVGHDLEKEPFNLATELYSSTPKDLKSSPQIQRQRKLYKIVEGIQKKIQVDWFGIYRKINYKGTSCLIKEAYEGAPSRAVFPLTKEFSEISNNSWVGINGKGKVIQDIRDYEGPYYECNAKVLSELCIPILSKEGEVLGIIDAESWKPNYFTQERISDILQVAYELGIMNMGL